MFGAVSAFITTVFKQKQREQHHCSTLEQWDQTLNSSLHIATHCYESPRIDNMSSWTVNFIRSLILLTKTTQTCCCNTPQWALFSWTKIQILKLPFFYIRDLNKCEGQQRNTAPPSSRSNIQSSVTSSSSFCVSSSIRRMSSIVRSIHLSNQQNTCLWNLVNKRFSCWTEGTCERQSGHTGIYCFLCRNMCIRLYLFCTFYFIPSEWSFLLCSAVQTT